MKIVVLDGYTLNPGDLDWGPLAALGDLEVHDRTPAGEVVARAQGAPLLLTNKVVLSREVLEQLPALKYIGVLATGYNVVDLAAARERGVAVANVPAYSTPSVAQMVFALLLELTQQVGHHAHLTRWGHWSECKDFAFWDRPLVELSGLTLGLVGFGAIGRQVAAIGRAFGMTVIVHTAHPERYAADPTNGGIAFVPLEELLRRSDVVSLHCPLTEATRGLIGAPALELMKPTAFLINTGRGPLLVEAAVAAALKGKRLAGAGLDVLASEPPPGNNPLLTAPNCFVTPHIAWATAAARQRLMTTVTANVAAFLAGTPQNLVN